jgi:hypothetical protein
MYGLPDSVSGYYVKKLAKRVQRLGRSRPPIRPLVVRYQFSVTNVLLYKPVLQRELKGPDGMVWRYMNLRGRAAVHFAKRQVGVQTGALQRSIKIQYHRPTSYGQEMKISANKSYAYYHHEGTNPHIILPVKNKVLRFTGRTGATVYATRVLHPGNRPNRYLSDQLRIFFRDGVPNIA